MLVARAARVAGRCSGCERELYARASHYIVPALCLRRAEFFCARSRSGSAYERGELSQIHFLQEHDTLARVGNVTVKTKAPRSGARVVQNTCFCPGPSACRSPRAPMGRERERERERGGEREGEGERERAQYGERYIYI